MQFRECLTFQRNVSSPSSRLKSKPKQKPTEAGSKLGLLPKADDSENGSNMFCLKHQALPEMYGVTTQKTVLY
jgi:hypothetical protein